LKKKLRILLTNNTLRDRAGSELVILELAKELRKRGHKPIAYSLVHGPVAHELNIAGIPTINNLNMLKEVPDIIHGQHNIEAMSAMLFFSDTPAIYVCHGWLPWEEFPPIFSNIKKYIAVGEVTRERIVTSCFVNESDVGIIPNWVDLNKFTLKDSISIKPKSAVIFSNSARDDGSHAKLIRLVCASNSIHQVDIVGKNSGNEANNPEILIKKYDLVFAVGRSALEAMSLGCAVILSDLCGAGEMVLPENFDALDGNFGLGSRDACNLNEAYLTSQILRYDEHKIKQVSNLVRAKVSLDDSVTKYEAIYYDAIELSKVEKHLIDTSSYKQRMREASNYLADAAINIKIPSAEKYALIAEKDALIADKDVLMAEKDALIADKNALINEKLNILQSRSWKLTALYRKLGKLIRNIFTNSKNKCLD
jgi:glycosyltransferase involved in cell wall biosynthesis